MAFVHPSFSGTLTWCASSLPSLRGAQHEIPISSAVHSAQACIRWHKKNFWQLWWAINYDEYAIGHNLLLHVQQVRCYYSSKLQSVSIPSTSHLSIMFSSNIVMIWYQNSYANSIHIHQALSTKINVNEANVNAHQHQNLRYLPSVSLYQVLVLLKQLI